MLQTEGIFHSPFSGLSSFCEYFPFSCWLHVWLWGILEFYHPYGLRGLEEIYGLESFLFGFWIFLGFFLSTERITAHSIYQLNFA